MTHVVAALIEREGLLLVCRRPEHKARGGLWEFPGGKVEGGESPAEALVRECREELGCRIAVGEVFDRVEHVYPDFTISLTLFRATVEEGEPTRLEHSELRWVAPSGLAELPFCPADEGIVAKIAATYAK